MITSQLTQYDQNFDDIIYQTDSDFISSKLKVSSVIKTSRLLIIEPSKLIQKTGGYISNSRLLSVKSKIVKMIKKV